ncbi:hypothetical protein J5N97_017931 [Dioscorea zingiberensis]|uniref:Uncharacterized protein n=1 Tax=Dioscorea zingiberensis TaxID=325984 RepID=A0A9D5CM96_9LILI|nr:hypothetical protein J5N97_017931 [Dioscorea zingiberensis]
MAMAKHSYTCALLLIVLILASEQTLVCKGRNLRLENNIINVVHQMRVQLIEVEGSKDVSKDHQMVSGTIGESIEVHDNASSLVGTEDARPTAPGHSPGVGHALSGQGVDKNLNNGDSIG